MNNESGFSQEHTQQVERIVDSWDQDWTNFVGTVDQAVRLIPDHLVQRDLAIQKMGELFDIMEWIESTALYTNGCSPRPSWRSLEGELNLLQGLTERL